jgi:hypothetical protein
MAFTEVRVQFANTNTNKRAFFLFLSKTPSGLNPYFAQTGDFRSERTWNQFDNNKQFVAAVNKYLNNPNASIERLELNGSTMSASDVAELDIRQTLLKIALDNLKG